ncbi:hypothetical protein HDU93_006102, partial [Gonapodya sp. JEL0774]
MQTLSHRHDRLTNHIAQFLRLTVKIPAKIAASRLEPIILQVTVPRTFSVEQLAHLIEAEYAFTYMLKRLGGPNPTSPLSTNDPDLAVLDVGDDQDPVEVGLLYDSHGRPLRFCDVVGDVLDMGDLIAIVDTFESTTSVRQAPTTISELDLFHTLTPSPESRSVSTAGIAPGSYADFAEPVPADEINFEGSRAPVVSVATLSDQARSLDDRLRAMAANEVDSTATA